MAQVPSLRPDALVRTYDLAALAFTRRPSCLTSSISWDSRAPRRRSAAPLAGHEA
jgi:hypothetical protein